MSYSGHWVRDSGLSSAGVLLMERRKMTAKIKPRIDLEGRSKLEEVIPLDTPYLVFLDPSDICNAVCSWCPTGRGTAKKYKEPQLMDFSLFIKIITDLCSMPDDIKTLRLYADGEPLINRDLVSMITYAKAVGCFGQIDTTTNGLLLNPSVNRRLVLAGLDKIFISVPKHYTPEYLANVKSLYHISGGRCSVYVKTIGDFLSETEKAAFMDDFKEISDRIFIENLVPCWPDFEIGEVQERGIYNQEIDEAVKVCPYIFYSVKINSNGLVSLCFLDWRHNMIIGDLAKDSFFDIWNGPMLRTRRQLMLQNRQLLPGCSNCQQLKYGAPDNIDPFAAQILDKL